jgi:hypothetical protein
MKGLYNKIKQFLAENDLWYGKISNLDSDRTVYRKDNVSFKELVKKDDVVETTAEVNTNNQNSQQPVIIIVNNDGNNGYGYNRNLQRRGIGLFSCILGFFYIIKNLIKICFVLAIIIGVFILVKNPHIINDFYMNILKKIGLYELIKKLM